MPAARTSRVGDLIDSIKAGEGHSRVRSILAVARHMPVQLDAVLCRSPFRDGY
jgi:hypothetical protein